MASTAAACSRRSSELSHAVGGARNAGSSPRRARHAACASNSAVWPVADDRRFGVRSQHEARVVARERDIGQPQLVDRSVGHAFHGPAEVVREEAGPEP